MSTPIVSVQDLSIRFPKRRVWPWSPRQHVHAVTNVSFDIIPGEILGVVGETGCGKSTLGRALLRLVDKGLAKISGTVLFEDTNLLMLDYRRMRQLRRYMAMVFQHPAKALNPRLTAAGNIAVPLANFGYDRKEIETRVTELMTLVGLRSDMVNRFPHEFSGGQQQRIVVARALALSPKFIVADEPTASLDASIRAQILNLLLELRERLGLTMVFISHDLRAVRYVSDRIAVMYLGRIVEIGGTDQIISHSQHPYTRALIAAIPDPDPDAKRIHERLTGELPSPVNPPSGCVFRTRCPFATEACAKQVPTLRPHKGRLVACDRLEEIS